MSKIIISTEIDVKTNAMLVEFAKDLQSTVSDVIKLAIEQYLVNLDEQLFGVNINDDLADSISHEDVLKEYGISYKVEQ